MFHFFGKPVTVETVIDYKKYLNYSDQCYQVIYLRCNEKFHVLSSTHHYHF